MESLPVVIQPQAVRPCRNLGDATSAQVPDPDNATHPEYPIERVCFHLYKPFQLTFARQAQQVLAQEEDIDVEASHRGLVLRGETESAFEGPVEILREYFGNQIRVGNPTIRYHNGTCFEEPHMGLRVRCSPEYVESVLADLESRRASVIDRGVAPAYGVIRATAPLANLLGYSRALLSSPRQAHT